MLPFKHRKVEFRGQYKPIKKLFLRELHSRLCISHHLSHRYRFITSAEKSVKLLLCCLVARVNLGRLLVLELRLLYPVGVRLVLLLLAVGPLDIVATWVAASLSVTASAASQSLSATATAVRTTIIIWLLL